MSHSTASEGWGVAGEKRQCFCACLLLPASLPGLRSWAAHAWAAWCADWDSARPCCRASGGRDWGPGEEKTSEEEKAAWVTPTELLAPKSRDAGPDLRLSQTGNMAPQFLTRGLCLALTFPRCATLNCRFTSRTPPFLSYEGGSGFRTFLMLRAVSDIRDTRPPCSPSRESVRRGHGPTPATGPPAR